MTFMTFMTHGSVIFDSLNPMLYKDIAYFGQLGILESEKFATVAGM